MNYGRMGDRQPLRVVTIDAVMADLFPAALVPNPNECIVLDGFNVYSPGELDDTILIAKGPSITGIDGRVEVGSPTSVANIMTNGDTNFDHLVIGDRIEVDKLATGGSDIFATVIGGRNTSILVRRDTGAWTSESDADFDVLLVPMTWLIDVSEPVTYTRCFRLVCSPGKSPQIRIGSGDGVFSLDIFYHIEQAPLGVNRVISV